MSDDLEVRIKDLEKKVQQIRDEAKQRELIQLKWGVRVLGALVLVMGGWIWAQVGHLFDLGGEK